MNKPRRPAQKPLHASRPSASRPAARRSPAPLGKSLPGKAQPGSRGAQPEKAVSGKAQPGRAAARPSSKPSVKPLAKPSASGAPVSRRPASGKSKDSGERLQKILAAAGIASRRACEEIILEGRVQVNGKTVMELGTRADAHRDEITVDLVPIHREALVYILLNKPKGYVTTVKDEEGRPTVMALLHGIQARVYPVGRLDFNSEGLLLMTNDGAMAKRLTDPDNHVPKIYLVKVHRTPNPDTLDEFRNGFLLNGRRLKPCGVEVVERADNPWLKVTLTEGKNQQIRRMFGAVGHPVAKLKRIQFGPLDDPSLKPGDWRFLNPHELAVLKNL